MNTPSETITVLHPAGGVTLSDALLKERVTLRSEGVTASGAPYSALLGGIYLGVVRSDHTGEPMHLFVDGEINGVPQRCHGFSAPEWTGDRATLKGGTDAVRTWETSVAEDTIALFYVNGTDADGNAASHPGEDYLRDSSRAEADYPLITDEAVAVEEVTADLMEAAEWQVAHIYRRTPDGMHVLVRTLTAPSAPPVPTPVREILAHLHITIPATDGRKADEIAAILMDALNVGLEGAADCEVDAPDAGAVVLALCEEL